jgi:hypothetical protein
MITLTQSKILSFIGFRHSPSEFDSSQEQLGELLLLIIWNYFGPSGVRALPTSSSWNWGLAELVKIKIFVNFFIFRLRFVKYCFV